MNEIEIEKKEENQVTEENIFIKIWSHPKQVFNFVTENQYDKYTNIILVLSGISRTFDRASLKNMGDNMSLAGVIAMCIIIGGMFGWISYYIYGSLISWTGKWLNGEANSQSIIRVISYALLPSVIGLIFLIPQIAVYGNEMFKSNGDTLNSSLAGNIIFYVSVILEFLLGTWSFLLCIIAISEVQKFSIGKALLNLLLPALIFIGIILVLVVAFKLIM